MALRELRRPEGLENRQGEPEQAGSRGEQPCGRAKFPRAGGLLDRLAVALSVGVVAALGLPRLPPGICFDDSGDLQLAAATLGIAHPPGYAGYVSLGYLLTLLPGLTPARAVTLGCFGAGLVALLLCGRLQVRLGASSWVAGAVMLMLASSPRFWHNLLVPEVYGPTLALEAAAICWLAGYVAGRRRPLLLAAAVALGLALANRPPVVLTLPTFVAACALGLRGQRLAGRTRRRDALLAAAGLLLPLVYSAAYVYVRDTPQTPCNYIERYRTVTGLLPAVDAGPAAKLERLAWLLGAREFRGLLASSSHELLPRLSWLIEESTAGLGYLALPAGVLAAVGVLVARRRCPSTTIALLGVVLAAAAFVCVYRVWDTAADLLPVLFGAAVFAGVGLSRLLPSADTWLRRAAGMILFAAAGAYAAFALARPAPAVQELDATAFVSQAGLADLPTGAAVISSWRRSVALQYCQYVELRRTDLRILGAHRAYWDQLIARHAYGSDGQPVAVYLADPSPPGPQYQPTPQGILWRVNAIPREVGSDIR